MSACMNVRDREDRPNTMTLGFEGMANNKEREIGESGRSSEKRMSCLMKKRRENDTEWELLLKVLQSW